MYPQEDSRCDFSDANEDYSNAYQRFLQLGYKRKNIDSETMQVTVSIKQYILYFL